MVGNDENILVEFDYQNIIIVDPNKIVDSEGGVRERQIKHENLVCYVSLECELLPRTRLAVGKGNLAEVRNVPISSVNFLSPGGEKFLKNTFYDEFTGEKNEKGELKYNQQASTLNSVQLEDKSTEYVLNQSTNNNVDTGLLGMKSVTININSAGFSEVNVELEDIRGRALFEKGEDSPYSTFFNLPYPIFYLTVKGYLGQAIKYQLSLLTFNASFDTESGNYKISLKFIAYKYNVLTSVSISHLLATPYMYNTTFKVSKPNQSPIPQNGETTQGVVEQNTSKGYGKIQEVYSEYKSKNLVDQDLPELTINQLVIRLERLEKYILESFGLEDLGPVTDANNYQKTLEDYNGRIYYFGKSWFNTNLDTKNPIVLKNGNVVYTFKNDIISKNQQQTSLSDLITQITNFNNELELNPTFGKNGKYTVSGKVFNSPIPIDIKSGDTVENVTTENIDITKTFTQRNNRQPSTPQELETFTSNLTDTIALGTWFSFNGQDKFLSKISKITDTFTKLSEEIDEKLSAALGEEIQKKENGLGFKPTIRNVCGILMANTEAFLRLMNDTHKIAWDRSNDVERRNAVFGQTQQTNPDDLPGNPVYPWPQYFVETNSDSGERFELRYPGDPKIINKTKAYLPELWPEVQFVEEYIKALVQTTGVEKVPEPVASDVGTTNRISLNSLDYYTTNRIFANKEEVKFFYEIYERVLLSPYYQRFNKNYVLQSQVSEVVSESETLNILNSLGVSSPYLISKLKNYSTNAAGYKTFLQSISNNGTGESWQKFIRDEFVTPYISEEVNNSFEIITSLNNSGIKSVQPKPNNIDKLTTFLNSTSTNVTDITDTYPFTVPNWYKSNLSNGVSSNQFDIYNTTKVLKFNESFKMISNYTSDNDTTSVRPITSFNYYTSSIPQINNYTGLKTFYTQRTLNDLLPTEGKVYYNNYLDNLTNIQTTSIFNTPYFHNSISESVLNLKNNTPNPFVIPAYLFLNSLPLSTLREKYRTFKAPQSEDLDYIFATLKKFGAIHKLPYAWILKYGSIWHRYKTYVEKNIDILDNVWTNFDYKYFYDPITSNPQKTYVITKGNTTQDIVLQKITNVGSNDLVVMNLGFYPVLINNYNYVLKGSDLFTLYNNQEFSDNLTTGYTLDVCTNSVINKNNGYNPVFPNESLKITPWVVTLQDTINGKQYIVPSFGSNVNQLEVELFKNGEVTNIPFSNDSVFNGSIRGFLCSPHYGYFDNSQLDKPDYDKYIKNIYSGQSQQESISFNQQKGYINLEDMFGVFNKEILDLFEKEFLKFSQSSNDFVIEPTGEEGSSNINNTGLLTEPNPEYKNFQLLLKQLLEITPEPFTNSQDFITKISQKQFGKMMSTIKGFLEYDVIFKYGNPSNYDRKLFDSFSTTNIILDRLTFEPYQPNTLPGDGVTVSQSESLYPQSWKTLRTYVGESNIPGLSYENNGSTITDFFINNNIEFSSNNIITLSPLIKIYATKKLNDQLYNPSKFTTDLNTFNEDNERVQNQILNTLLQSIRNRLPNIEEVPESVQQSSDTGTQNKLELWETFKSFNDAWIAGTDYSQTLLFEDVLFLDRGNRDVGNLILVDPFKVSNFFSNLNISASCYSYLTTILETHKMTPMMLPAYVNYYNVVDGTNGAEAYVDSTTEFGNNLFGTYLNVDTRKSSPKLIARYSEPGSKYLDNDQTKNPNFRFKSDAADLSNPTLCPFIDKLNGKTDWSKSNRVVGFNVDIGIRNQNVFKNFSVSQELGKQTTESLTQLDKSINQSSGRNSTTQNVSLYNFYKNRSYKCTVTSLGNSMIQPTMYFNLRHVPMFTGPYLIMSVKHTITPGNFVTTFEGTRQSIFSLPKVTDYIQSITKNLLNSLRERKRQELDSRPVTSKVQNNISEVQKGYVNNTQKLSGSQTGCTENLKTSFSTYTKLDGTVSSFNGSNNTQTYLSVSQMTQKIQSVTNTPKMKTYIFVLSYLESYRGQFFNCYNNNFSGIRLNTDYNKTMTDTYFKNCYSCQKQSDGTTIPYAVFTGDDYFKFMLYYLQNKLINFLVTKESISEFYFKKWIQTVITDESYTTFKNTTQYTNFEKEIENAINLAKSNNL